MKKITLLILLFSGAVQAQNINIPDASFKVKLLSASPENTIAKNSAGNYFTIDANGNGEIDVTEALAVYEINVNNNEYQPVGPFITDLTGILEFPNLRSLECVAHHITSLDVSTLFNLQKLNCRRNELTAININNLVTLQHVDCSFNQITALDVSNLTNLTHLDCRLNAISSLNVLPLTNLLYLSCEANQLTSIDVSTLSLLKFLSFSVNQINTINLNGLSALESLNCRSNNLSTIDLSVVPTLLSLDISHNNFTSIDISPLTNLKDLSCVSNQLTALDFTGLPNLRLLQLENNLLTSLDITGKEFLLFLNFSDNQISAIDLTGAVMLGGVFCDNNLLTTIDGSQNPQLTNLTCENNQLTSLFLKNGGITVDNSNFNFSGNPDLEYICVDEAEAAIVQLKIVEYGNTNTVMNTYCSFTPGGNYNTITGVVSFDANNNGCDAIDPKQPNFKLQMNDGATIGASFTSGNGDYNFYTLNGNFTITPQVENPSFFNFSPANAVVAFSNSNNNVSANNFCVTANGIHPDVEVVIAPLTRARSGFDATYQLVYKNKGNQILSGNVTFNYDDAVLDLIAVTTPPNIQNPGLLQWNYTNLLPFEMRSVNITLNLNSMMETPPLNIGDVLNFTANITPSVGDAFPADNTFAFNQDVVNAFDPNEITCLEGNALSPAEIGNYLHYIVNFENLGNAEAENVVVKIDVDPTLYDINSFQLLNTSHGSYSRISGNTIEFVFQNIQLAPAQGDPAVGGHGTILFKIKSDNSLVNGDRVVKMANIFFDYNFPIATENAETVFESLKTPGFENDNSVAVYPNPASGMVNIQSDSKILSLELYDVQGRLLQTGLESNKVDLSSRTNGLYFLKIKTENGQKVEKIIKN